MGRLQRQFVGLFKKNIILMYRNWRFWAMGVGLPIAFAILTGVLSIVVSKINIPSSSVDPGVYLYLKSQPVPYFTLDPNVVDLGRVFQSFLLPIQGSFYGYWPWFKEYDSIANFTNDILATPIQGPYNFGAYSFTAANFSTGVFQARVMYNSTMGSNVAVMTKYLSEGVYRNVTGLNGHFTETASPFQDTAALAATIFSYFGPLVLTYALGFFMSLFGQRMVEDRELKVTQTLLVNGADLRIMWLSSWAGHIVIFLFPALVTFIVLEAFQVAMVAYNTWFACFFLLVMTGPSLIGQGYVLSFLFTSAEKARRWLAQICSFAIIIPYLIFTVGLNNPTSPGANYVLSFFFPTFALYRGYTILALTPVTRQPITFAGIANPDNQIGVLYLIQLLSAVAYFGSVLFIEYMMERYRRRKHDMVPPIAPDVFPDDDVAKEYERISSGRPTADVVKIVDLSKQFTSSNGVKQAVSNLCLGVRENECFGLLGPNGAGKSTTINIMCGVEVATSGDAYLDGLSALREMPRVRSSIGVCSQYDALWEEMTGREHLEVYAAVKNVPKATVANIITTLATRVRLMEHIDKRVKTYSGGTKRKLSMAMAFIGAPRVVLLDEPSSGMDPVARRAMWDIITELKEGRSIILTTHSMEEADALCSRIGIMIASRLECLGTVQHLKNKHGGGYRLSLTTVADQTDAVKGVIMDKLPGSVLASEFEGTLTYTVPKDVINLADLFDFALQLKRDFNVADYSVSQTTLEQVFLALCKKQEDREAAAEREQAAPPPTTGFFASLRRVM